MYVHVGAPTCVNTTKFVLSVAASVEILQKEVVVHKEMVAELRTQLAEKEQEFQVSYMYMHVTCNVHNNYPARMRKG